MDLEFSLVSINKFKRKVSSGSLLHCRFFGSTSEIAASLCVVYCIPPHPHKAPVSYQQDDGGATMTERSVQWNFYVVTAQRVIP